MVEKKWLNRGGPHQAPLGEVVSHSGTRLDALEETGYRLASPRGTCQAVVHPNRVSFNSQCGERGPPTTHS